MDGCKAPYQQVTGVAARTNTPACGCSPRGSAGVRSVPVPLSAGTGAAGGNTEVSAGRVRVVDCESAGLSIVTQGAAVTCRCNVVCGCVTSSICQGASRCTQWWKPLRYGGGSGHPAAPGQQQSSGQGQRAAECGAAPQGTQLNQPIGQAAERLLRQLLGVGDEAEG